MCAGQTGSGTNAAAVGRATQALAAAPARLSFHPRIFVEAHELRCEVRAKEVVVLRLWHGRERGAVTAPGARREESGALYPNPRTSGGPSTFATGTGSRFHSAMNSRYFGLLGLFSGIAAPSARR